MAKSRNVSIIEDLNGDRIVVINDIIFKGKRKIEWNDVEEYLQRYVGEFYEIADTKEIIYIGTDLPDEYANSNYTHRLKGTSAKAKANAAQGIPEMIEIATEKLYGWYKYESKFALPVYDRSGNVERYNIFDALMVIRCSKEHKMYLYDIIEIKKK